VDSVRERARDVADPLYVDVLRAHWVEESQHTKSDTLELLSLTRELEPADIEAAFEQVLGIAALVDATFRGQAEQEIETFQETTGRVLAAEDATALREALYRSLQNCIAGVGLRHPSFVTVARQLSRRGAAILGIA